jgi:hypothetical protein
MVTLEIGYNRAQADVKIGNPEEETDFELDGTRIIRTAYRLLPIPADVNLSRDFGLSDEELAMLSSAAAGLALTLPTGRTADFHGTGTTRVAPALIASRAFGQRLELLANVGADFDAEDLSRTVVRWVVGGTVSIVDPLAASVVFLGRHELARQTDPIRVPFFFQIERNDIYDASVGLRWRFAEAGVLSGNALMPLNRDGLRADVIPTVQVEYTF